MINVGIIVDNDFNSDIRVRREVNILRQHGYHVHVLCLDYGKKYYPQIEGVRAHRINMRKKVKDVLFFFSGRLPLYELVWRREIKKFIEENEIGILHVHDLYMSKAAHKGIADSNPKLKMILDLHENYPVAIESYNWTHGFLRHFIANASVWAKREAEYLAYASKIILLSQHFKDDLLSRYDFLQERDIVPFANVIDLRRFEHFEVNHSIEKGDKISLLYFGAVAERRGVYDAMRAVSSLAQERSDIELLIIGPVDKADKSRFFRKLEEPAFRDVVRYIPWIDISELTTYLHLSDICLSPLIKNPQHESGVANKIFQYMYGSKPIIVSDCRPQKELIESFDCGIAYSTQREFVDAIRQMVVDPDLRERLGANGYRMLYERFDNVDYDNILLGVYEGVERSMDVDAG